MSYQIKINLTKIKAGIEDPLINNFPPPSNEIMIPKPSKIQRTRTNLALTGSRSFAKSAPAFPLKHLERELLWQTNENQPGVNWFALTGQDCREPAKNCQEPSQNTPRTCRTNLRQNKYSTIRLLRIDSVLRQTLQQNAENKSGAAVLPPWGASIE